ncbi:MAG: hypothetical protein ACT4PP_13750 [Sporichthyaceae bacterium]
MTSAPAVTRGSRPYGMLPILGLFFGALVVLNLVITGLSDPPSIVPPVSLDPNTGVPPVPTNADFPYDRTASVVAIVLLGGIGMIGLVWALREVVTKRDPMPLCLSLGTVAIVIPEVFVDIVGMVYYPTDDADHAFDLFGRQMGWFILAGWFGAGAFGAMMLKVLLTRPPARQVWTLLAVTAASYTIFEELLVGAGGIYHYYGNQPMWWFNLPLWWTPCNTLGAALLPALFAYRYQAIMRGWRAVLMILVVPTCVSAGYALIAMPGWIVVNADYAWLPTELAGLAVWALGIAVAAMAMNLLCGYQPFDPQSRPWDLSAGEDAAPGGGEDSGAAPVDARPRSVTASL